ncbi:DHA2 family efflux MFS transporter permease subunit [Kurthia sp. Dielmo]|uniref:DHA2 family efflux MFS transporter permease subunit n=1 Tax=Kurthia sp. Dielmo TaxID=1033738 RepID=UPI00111CF9AA|nr:DHA2 family efflux MFS transporter permease subunit [Kurthia sp. Dielmo]
MTTEQQKNPKPMIALLMIATFVGLFGETAMNMAITNVMTDFNVSAGTAQWLTTGYLLVLGILVPVSALIIQWISTRGIIILAFVFSIVGSIIGAIAPNFEILLLARVIQAVGTGLVLPLMINVILIVVPITKRGAAMGIMGMVITLAPAIGPTLAGFIVDVSSWHYIFWVSVVLYIILIVVFMSKVYNVTTLTKPKIDFLSVILSTVAFGGIIYGLSTFSEGTTASTVGLVAGIVALLLFVWRQFASEQPMIDLHVFKYRNFTIGSLLLFISFALILAMAILMPMYLKGSLLLTATSAGLAMLVGNILNAALAPVVGNTFDRVGAKIYLTIGFLCFVIATVMLYVFVSATTPLWIVIVAYMIFFIGASTIIMPAQTNSLNELPKQLYTHGSAVLNTFQQIAGAAGTAIAITLMTTGQASYATEHPKASIETLIAAGIEHAFFFIVLLAVIGFVLSLFVTRPKMNH